MSISLNEVKLIGYLGQKPEVRLMQSGKEVASFSLATTKVWKDKRTGERVEKTEWHQIVIFNQNLVSIVKKHLEKGMPVYIQGELEKREWTDGNGNKRYSVEVVLRDYNSTIKMLNKPSQSKQEPAAENEVLEEFDDEEIPF